MNNNMMQFQREAKYKSARISLLLILICSVINIFSTAFINTYFLFSAYLSGIFAQIGAVFYYETGSLPFFVIFALIALVTLVPYLLCYIFSKKHPGWMIAALVMFSLDSLLLLFDFVTLAMAGDFSQLTNILFHAYGVFCLAYAVKCGFAKLAPDSGVAPAAPLVSTDAMPVVEPAADLVAEEMNAISRRIVIRRKKAFTGCAVRHLCYIDGTEIGKLKNGATLELMTSGAAHELTVMTPGGDAATVTIPADGMEHHYSLSIKMSLLAAKLSLKEISPHMQ